MFKLDLCAYHPSNPASKHAGLTRSETPSERRTIVAVDSDRKPLFDDFGLCYYRDYRREHL
jgi:hypothetical protein